MAARHKCLAVDRVNCHRHMTNHVSPDRDPFRMNDLFWINRLAGQDPTHGQKAASHFHKPGFQRQSALVDWRRPFVVETGPGGTNGHPPSSLPSPPHSIHPLPPTTPCHPQLACADAPAPPHVIHHASHRAVQHPHPPLLFSLAALTRSKHLAPPICEGEVVARKVFAYER